MRARGWAGFWLRGLGDSSQCGWYAHLVQCIIIKLVSLGFFFAALGFQECGVCVLEDSFAVTGLNYWQNNSPSPDANIGILRCKLILGYLGEPTVITGPL